MHSCACNNNSNNIALCGLPQQALQGPQATRWTELNWDYITLPTNHDFKNTYLPLTPWKQATVRDLCWCGSKQHCPVLLTAQALDAAHIMTLECQQRRKAGG
jgi:hypothetical protein